MSPGCLLHINTTHEHHAGIHSYTGMSLKKQEHIMAKTIVIVITYLLVITQLIWAAPSKLLFETVTSVNQNLTHNNHLYRSTKFIQESRYKQRITQGC